MPSASSEPDITVRMALMAPMPRYIELSIAIACASSARVGGGACLSATGTMRPSSPNRLPTSTMLEKTMERMPKVRGAAVTPVAGCPWAGYYQVSQPDGGQPKTAAMPVVTPFCRLSQAAP